MRRTLLALLVLVFFGVMPFVGGCAQKSSKLEPIDVALEMVKPTVSGDATALRAQIPDSARITTKSPGSSEPAVFPVGDALKTASLPELLARFIREEKPRIVSVKAEGASRRVSLTTASNDLSLGQQTVEMLLSPTPGKPGSVDIEIRPSDAGRYAYTGNAIFVETEKRWQLSSVEGAMSTRPSQPAATATAPTEGTPAAGGSAGGSTGWQHFKWADFAMQVTDVKTLASENKLSVRYFEKPTTGTTWPAWIDWTFVSIKTGAHLTVKADEQVLATSSGGGVYDQLSKLQNPDGTAPIATDVAIVITNSKSGAVKTVPLSTLWTGK